MGILTVELYKVAQIRKIEAMVFEELGRSETDLMQRAGEAALDVFKEHFPGVQSASIICGKGNNGGDGYMLAHLLHQQDVVVTVYALCGIDELSGAAKAAASLCKESAVTILPFDQDTDFAGEVLVDAILGIGIEGDIRGAAAAAIAAINDSDLPVLALDTPSGLNVDTGQILGQAVEANVTVAFIGLKQGMLTADGPAVCGEIEVDTLAIDDSVYEQVAINAIRVDILDVQSYLPPREVCAHKGDFGHVVIVGGDYGMPGAVRMAGEAAARVGAGLVSVVTRPEHVAAVTAMRPELMCYGVKSADALDDILKRATVVAIGPGLGQSEWSQGLFKKVIATDLPLVVDASALALLADNPIQRDNWILTPHPGEAARLLNISAATVQRDRFQAAMDLHSKYGGTIVLKGAGTLIQSPDCLPELCDAGNPGMASGGMGDVLTGVIAGLRAQHFAIHDAARFGVCIHANAGDRAAINGERGLLAMDLLPELVELINEDTSVEDMNWSQLPGFSDAL